MCHENGRVTRVTRTARFEDALLRAYSSRILGLKICLGCNRMNVDFIAEIYNKKLIMGNLIFGFRNCE